MEFKFKKLLQKDGWTNDVAIATDNNGTILSIEELESSDGMDLDYAIPGFQNAHSHAFQYAMAGITEHHSPEKNADDFWSWRTAMYKLALSVEPDQLGAIATMLYSEMRRHGYTNVAEFHYLHHDKDGNPYGNLAEMGSCLISAAKTAGIGITLVPIFYQKGGFGKSPLENQRRFISATLDDYEKLFEASERACEEYKSANIAIGIHSMRAVESEFIIEAARSFPQDIPFHIHISEQLAEVEECKVHLGKRPVEWMLDNIELSDRFHFVHATHLERYEIKGLADSRVNVVLCPTTEGNLGDGVFPLREFQEMGGSWSIGTDSHVSLNPFEELRLLDYGQRLISHKRNTFTSKSVGNSGLNAIEQSQMTGRKAMNNFSDDYFSVGQQLNACIISNDHPLIQLSSHENLLNTIIYSSDETMQKGAVVNGKLLEKVENDNRIRENFVGVLKELNIR